PSPGSAPGASDSPGPPRPKFEISIPRTSARSVSPSTHNSTGKGDSSAATNATPQASLYSSSAGDEKVQRLRESSRSMSAIARGSRPTPTPSTNGSVPQGPRASPRSTERTRKSGQRRTSSSGAPRSPRHVATLLAVPRGKIVQGRPISRL